MDLAAVEAFVAQSEPRQGQAAIVGSDKVNDIFDQLSLFPDPAYRKAIFAISWFGGLRVGEIAQLTIGDLINEKGELRERGELTRRQTKTNNWRTLYWLHPGIKKYVLPYIKARLYAGANRSDLLFEKRTGGAYRASNLAMWMKRTYRKLGLPDCSSHSGRAGMITHLIDATGNVKLAQMAVGHTNVKTTLRYQRVTEDQIMKTLRSM